MVVFAFGDKTFKLEFERKHEEVDLVRRTAGVKKVKSRYPYTIAKLYIVPTSGNPPTLMHQAKVGCAPIDHYSHAAGRLHALKLLSKVLRTQLRNDKPYQQGLVAAMWEAYQNRATQQKAS